MGFGPSERQTREDMEQALWTGSTSNPEAQRRLLGATGRDFRSNSGSSEDFDLAGFLALLGLGLGFLLIVGPSAMAYRSMLRPQSPTIPMTHPGLPFFLLAWWGMAWVLARRVSGLLAFTILGTGLGVGVLLDPGPQAAVLLLWVELAFFCRWAAAEPQTGGILRGLRDLALFLISGGLLLAMLGEPKGGDLRAIVEMWRVEALALGTQRYPLASAALEAKFSLPPDTVGAGIPLGLLGLGLLFGLGPRRPKGSGAGSDRVR